MDAELGQRRLPQLFEAAKSAGFAGINITFPFKQDVLPLLDDLDSEAAQIGAVKTAHRTIAGNS